MVAHKAPCKWVTSKLMITKAHALRSHKKNIIYILTFIPLENCTTVHIPQPRKGYCGCSPLQSTFSTYYWKVWSKYFNCFPKCFFLTPFMISFVTLIWIFTSFTNMSLYSLSCSYLPAFITGYFYRWCCVSLFKMPNIFIHQSCIH